MNPPLSPPPAPFSSELRVDKCILENLRKRKNEIMEKLKTSTITDKDVLNLEPHPSDYRLAYFASEVYKDNCTIPDDWDWKLLVGVANKSKGNGYVGAAFFNPIHQQIIIAHRGTNSLNAVWTDLKSVVWGSISAQIHSALTFADFIRGVIVELHSEKRWRYQLSFTGHSLGGFLAQITTFGVKYLQRYNDLFLKATVAGVHSHCVTFDNPGCAEILNQITDHCDLRYLKTIFTSTLDMTAYLSAPNKVNMCHRHVGVLLRLKLPFQKMSFLSAHTPRYHLKAHSMDTIKSVFDPDEVTISVDVDQIFDWPNSVVFSNEEYNKFFRFGKKKTNFSPDIERTVVSIGDKRFNTIRYLPKRHSLNSCNVSLFSEDELFLLKHWLKIVKSPVMINEQFAPLNRSFKDLFSQFMQIGDDLLFPDETSMKQTIKRCKQIFRWYPEEIKKCLSSLLSKSHGVIMKVAVDSYNESFNNCNVDFIDSVELESFLQAKENVLLIESSANNYKIEMLRLFTIFKQIRSKQSHNINKYTGSDNFLIVNQSYLLSLFKYTEVDLFINSQLNLLFVDLLNETVNDDVSNLIKRFAKGVRKVVIVNGTINLSSTTSKAIASLEFKFTDLTVDSQKWALNKKIIKFQNETYSLANFFNAANDNWKKISEIVNDYQFLDLLLNDRCIELNNDSLNLSKLENFYIHADNDHSYSYDDFFKLIEDSECDLNESKILITYACNRLSLKFRCDQLQTADLNEAAQYFKERCNEESLKKFYWFHYDQNVSLQQIYDPELYIPRSFFYKMVLNETKVTDSIKEQLLRQENEGANNAVTVELTNTGNRSVKCNFRIDRKSNKVTYVWNGKDNNNEIDHIRHFLTISRDGSLAERELVDRRILLITGDPGIGKSTTVTNLISKIERSWVFKLTYNDCRTIVKRLSGEFKHDQISEQLLKIKSTNEFDFLKYHLTGKTPIKVVFLFDEIFDSSYDQNNERPIIEFLKYLRDETESLVIVTSRETKREMLEDALETFSIRFEQLNRKDVEGYLTNCWSDLLHLDLKLKRLALDGLNDYIKRLLDRATEIFDTKILNFVGIPLQMKLLAEVAAPDYRSLSKKSLDWISSELPDSLTGIYEAFVEKKLAIVCNKEPLGESSSIKKVYLESIEKKLQAFSATKYGFYDDNFDELETLQQTGLIQGSEFIHQTIQEFYFARQIFSWLKERNGRRGDNRPELVEFLLKKIFDSCEFSIARMFLETYISQINPEDAPFYSREIVKEIMQHDSPSLFMDRISSKRILRSLIRENCHGIVRFLLESFKKYENEAKALLPFLTKNDFCDETVLCMACQDNQTHVIDYIVQFLETQSTEIQNKIIIDSFYRLPSQESLDVLGNFIARISTSSARNVKEIADLVKKEIGLLSDFMLAAKNGSLEIVRNCLRNVSDTLKPHLLSVHSSSHEWNNALHLAIKHDHPEIVRLLIEHGSNVNQVNSVVNTPIDLASETGNLEILRILIEHGGDYMKQDSFFPPFHTAVQKGHTDIVKYFLDELKYKEVNKMGLYGDTALHYAVMNKHKSVVELLLNYDAVDVNGGFRDGWKPLDYAVEMGDFELIEMIVKAGATIDFDDYYDYDDAFLIRPGSNVSKENWASMILLAHACDTGNLDMLRFLIENGDDYKKGDNRGVTSFHRAATRGHVDIVKYFLDELKYEEVNQKDSYGDTALHRAAGNKHIAVLELLLKCDGIDANAKNCLGIRPYQAVFNWGGDDYFYGKFREAGATIDRNDCKPLPVKMARRYTPKDIVKYLYELNGKRSALVQQ